MSAIGNGTDNRAAAAFQRARLAERDPGWLSELKAAGFTDPDVQKLRTMYSKDPTSNAKHGGFAPDDHFTKLGR
jgi:hypothetical protein